MKLSSRLKKKLRRQIPNKLATKCFKPFKILNPFEWSVKFRKILKSESDIPQKFNTRLRPYQKKPLQNLADTKKSKKVLLWSSQMGKTILVSSVIGAIISQWRVARILHMMPTGPEINKFAKKRFEPFLAETKVLADLLVGGINSKKQSLITKVFKGERYHTFVPSGSSSALSGEPANVIIIEEWSRCAQTAKTADGKTDEGSSSSLLGVRLSEATNPLMIHIGTPTTKGECPTEALFLESDQQYYEVPCPSCGRFFFLAREIFTWDGKGDTNARDDYSSAHFACECGYKFDKTDLTQAYEVDSCQWIARQPDSDIEGYHLNRAYSLSTDWTGLAERLDKAQKKYSETGNSAEFRVEVNTSWGEAFSPQLKDASSWQALMALRDKPFRDEDGNILIPKKVKKLVCFADTQGDRFEITLLGLYKRELWVIDHIHLRGTKVEDEADEMFKLFKDFMQKRFKREDGILLKPDKYLVDSKGSYQRYVIRFCQKHQPYLVPTYTNDNLKIYVSTAKKAKLNLGNNRLMPTDVNIYGLGTDYIKDEAFYMLGKAVKDHKDGHPLRIHFSGHLDEKYFRGLASEVPLYGGKSKGARILWKTTYKRNEPWDCLVGCLASIELQSYSRWSDEYWESYDPAGSKTSFKEVTKLGQGAMLKTSRRRHV